MTTKTMAMDQWAEMAEHEPRRTQREGQFWYNFLHLHRPDLADQVRGNLDIDPFYEDSNLRAFFTYVYQHWYD